MKNSLQARTWFRLAAIVCLFLPMVGIAHRAALRAAQGNAVKIVPNGGALEGNPGEKGATYYALEAQTTRIARFRAIRPSSSGVDPCAAWCVR